MSYQMDDKLVLRRDGGFAIRKLTTSLCNSYLIACSDNQTLMVFDGAQPPFKKIQEIQVKDVRSSFLSVSINATNEFVVCLGATGDAVVFHREGKEEEEEENETAATSSCQTTTKKHKLAIKFAHHNQNDIKQVHNRTVRDVHFCPTIFKEGEDENNNNSEVNINYDDERRFLFVSGADDHRLCLTDIKLKCCIHSFDCESGVNTCQWNRTGKFVAAGLDNGNILCFVLDQEKDDVSNFHLHSTTKSKFSLVPYFSIGRRGGNTYEQLFKERVWCLKWTTDSNFIIACSEDRSGKALDVSEYCNNEEETLQTHHHVVASSELNNNNNNDNDDDNDDNYYSTNNSQRFIPMNFQACYTLEGATNVARSLAVTPGASVAKSLLQQHREQKHQHQQEQQSCARNRSGIVAIASWDGFTRCYYVATGQQVGDDGKSGGEHEETAAAAVRKTKVTPSYAAPLLRERKLEKETADVVVAAETTSAGKIQTSSKQNYAIEFLQRGRWIVTSDATGHILANKNPLIELNWKRRKFACLVRFVAENFENNNNESIKKKKLISSFEIFSIFYLVALFC